MPKYLLLALSLCTLSGCNKPGNVSIATAVKTGAVVELPEPVLGVFTGTVIGTPNGGQPVVSQFANATVSKNGKDISISFSGGIPVIDAKIPSVQHLKFVDAGLGDETYKSSAENGSVAGVYLSSYKTNLNIDNVNINGIKIGFTGVKCDVVPESLLCTCVTNPGSVMCRKY